MNAKEMKKGETSLEGDAVRKKKDILFNMFSLYAQRYILLDIWKEDAKESDSSKELLEKAQKLFAYSESEDDPRDKRAQAFPIILKISRWSFGKPWIAGEGNWKIYYVKHMIKSMENKFPDFGV